MVAPEELEQVTQLPPLPARLGADTAPPAARLAELRDLPWRYGSREVMAITYIGDQALCQGDLQMALDAKELLQRPDSGWRQRIANQWLGRRVHRAYWDSYRLQ